MTLTAGERRALRFKLAREALAFWDTDMKWRVEPGSITISAGAS